MTEAQPIGGDGHANGYAARIGGKARSLLHMGPMGQALSALAGVVGAVMIWVGRGDQDVAREPNRLLQVGGGIAALLGLGLAGKSALEQHRSDKQAETAAAKG